MKLKPLLSFASFLYPIDIFPVIFFSPWLTQSLGTVSQFSAFFANSIAALQAILKEYHQRILKLEDCKYDLEFTVRQKDFEVIFRREPNHH